MRLDHPIFQGPLRANIALEPDEWNEDYDDRGVWVVQTGELGKEVDYGVVSDGHGFEDSPDCERISGGINSKGPRAVAIGRQANMLQWGFYAAPDRMTESAQKVFLNALVYMKRFDGDRPVVEKTVRARSWLEQYVGSVRDLEGQDGQARKQNESRLAGRFPDGWVAEAGFDADALLALYRENEEYIWSPSTFDFRVDEHLQGLGVSNRTPAFLDYLVERLDSEPVDETALFLAHRYFGPHGRDAKTALRWIDENREWLFFSDTGGFRWLVDENAKRRATNAQEPLGARR